MAPRRALDVYLPWFGQAFAEFMPDEDVLWELGLITLVDPRPLKDPESSPGRPEEQASTAFVSSIVLHVEAPGVVEGTHLATTILMNMSTITEEHARDTVQTLSAKLPAQRAAQEQELRRQQVAGDTPMGGRL